MNTKSARACLYLVLPGLLLGSAATIGAARHIDTVTVQAPIVLMQLQAHSEPYENAAAPETGKTDTPELCAASEQHCESLTQERAMVRLDDRAQPESRSRAPVEEIHSKSRNRTQSAD